MLHIEVYHLRRIGKNYKKKHKCYKNKLNGLQIREKNCNVILISKYYLINKFIKGNISNIK